MKTITLLGALLAMATMTHPGSASDATLVLRLSGVSGANPQALDMDTGQLLAGAVAASDWIYQLDFGNGQIVKRLKLTIGNIPNSEMLSNLSINYPFFRKGDLLLVLAPPVDAGGGSDAARRLWATSVQDMSSDQLLQFYQRAKRVAEDRTDNWQTDWIKVHPYDIRAVLKYLETVVKLSNQLYIVPPDDVSMARDWLSDAIINAQDAVGRGVGLANAKSLVKDIDLEEGVRFGLLWEQIKAVPCDHRKLYLEAYRDWFLTVPSDQRRDRIVNVTGVPFASIQSAISQCVASLAKEAAASGSAEQKEAAKTALTKHIDSLQQALSETASGPVAKKLNSDISVLTNMRSLF